MGCDVGACVGESVGTHDGVLVVLGESVVGKSDGVLLGADEGRCDGTTVEGGRFFTAA